MLSKIKTNKGALIIAIAIFVVFCINMIPLFYDGIVDEDDCDYHLSRIKNIQEEIENGDFTVKIHPRFLNDHGYGSGLFYPNFFLYLPAILMVAGISFNLAYNIFLTLIFVALLFTSYYAAKQIFKNEVSALFAAVLYFSSQAIMSNVYGRAAIGEALATIFIPLVIAALHNIVYEDFTKPQLLIVAFLGLVLSHTITLFLSAIVCVFFLVINYKKLFCDKSKPKNHGLNIIIKGIKCALIVLALSVAYWLPMLEQFTTAAFNVSDPWTTVSDNMVEPYKLFATQRPGVGIILLISALVFIGHPSIKRTSANRFLFAGITIALLTTWLVPWRIFDNTIFNSIQFPWRLLPYSAAFLSLGVAGSVPLALSDETIKKYSVIVLVGCSLLTLNNSLVATKRIAPLRDDIYRSSWAVGFAEWVPEDTDTDLLLPQDYVISDSIKHVDINERKGTALSFTVDEGTRDCEYFDIPLLYYKGYTATITTENGEKKPLEIDYGSNNKIRVYNDNQTGEVLVSYEGTAIQKTAYAVNIIAVLTVAGYLCFVFVNRKKYKLAEPAPEKATIN